MAELDAMQPRTSQYAPGDEVPERSLVYRVVKKHFFNDFGAYREIESRSLGGSNSVSSGVDVHNSFDMKPNV